ncbi:cytochrome c oxidase, subunit III [Bacteriovorax sp. BAL6_X]|uniref:cytochrome c oxidase subunit 3 n=1 Tax=Bacteriovorax sp. BAL6_X TaxID=1201290 RepID=UPI000385F8A2|nr:cytochrome c oxidase subunit 3 [Bacteriovorax sp. BAL6_X]EPZ50422.1 cytochrome c oxidase, subunit III [Bacteriovorax sp. BAL6_X]
MNQVMSNKELEARKITSSIAMIVLLVSFTMLFASMLLGYSVYRLTVDVWPPMGMPRIPLTIPVVSTIVIALSSVTLVLFESAFNKQNTKAMRLYFALTYLLGLGFMFVQWQLWNSMAAMGLQASGGVFPSLFYALTWTHAAHIVLGLIALLFLLPVSMKGYSMEKVTWVQNVSKFWHFLGVVWLVMFIVMFVF